MKLPQHIESEVNRKDTLLERIENFFSEINFADTLDQILLVLEQQTKWLGFDYFSYWAYYPSSISPVRFAVTNYDESWKEYYTKERLSPDDYTAFYSAKSISPFIWSSIKENVRLTKAQLRVYQDSADAGLKNGASIPIHGPGTIKASFSVASNILPSAFERLFALHRHELQLLATYSHQKIVELRLEKPFKGILKLTPREVEILTWAAQGKTRSEISIILGIKEDTVRAHIESARTKLNASNITQAIAVALFNGLIHP